MRLRILFFGTAEEPESEDSRGCLSDIASKVLMKVLYAARLARFDLLRATCALAREVTKCNSLCDKKLHRLISYINSTLEVRMYSWCGHNPADLTCDLFL